MTLRRRPGFARTAAKERKSNEPDSAYMSMNAATSTKSPRCVETR